MPPPADPTSLVVAELELDLPPSARIRNLLYEPPTIRVDVGGKPRILIATTAAQPHLVRPSPAEPAIPVGRFRARDTLRLTAPDIGYRVRFYEIPFGAPRG